MGNPNTIRNRFTAIIAGRSCDLLGNSIITLFQHISTENGFNQINLNAMDIENEKKLEINQFEQLIQGLINDQYGYCDNFIKENSVSGLRNNLQKLDILNEMQSAGLGKELNYQKNKQIRGDKIKWIEKESEDQYERIFLNKIANFIDHLNKTCYTSIKEFESHYASYPQKHFYKRHLDQFKHNKRRKYSIVLYLNESWKSEDGGILSLYPKGGEQINISPIGGSMVFFRSDEMEHEVHPSFTRDRISIAGWFKD